MNYLDLFHGIGGFALGAYWAGMKFENHYCSDIEQYCVELYKKRFPDSIQLGDITKINCDDLPKGEWIITGGFPCQDISIAGKGVGIEGKRSGLWFTYADIISKLRPRYAIMENVGALTIRGLDAVLGSLAEIGYDAEWQDIRAEDVGAPHKRERIWIVAYPESEQLETGFFQSGEFDKSKDTTPENWSEFRYVNRGNNNVDFRQEDEHFICGMDDGVSNRVDRLKGLGNAIVPQIAELLFKQILSTEK